MSAATRTYRNAPACWAPLTRPGVTRIWAALDWSHQATTPDQAGIEAVLEPLVVTGTSVLHVEVGNAQLAQRCAGRAHRLDGLRLAPQEQARKRVAAGVLRDSFF